MANRLKMALSESIFTLHLRGWSQQRIARELGIDDEASVSGKHSATPAPAETVGAAATTWKPDAKHGFA